MAQEIKKQDTTSAAPARLADPFGAMRAEMDRLFDTFMGRGGAGRLPSLSTPWEGELSHWPSIDIRENDGALIMEAEMPGLDEKDVELTLKDGVLTIKGEKKVERDEKKDDYHIMERRYGSFQRSFRLPESVDEEQVKAAFEKGLLRVTMPKRPEAVKAEKKISIAKG